MDVSALHRTAYAVPASAASLLGFRAQPRLARRLLGLALADSRARTAAHALLSLPLNVLTLAVAAYGWLLVLVNVCYPLRPLDLAPSGTDHRRVLAVLRYLGAPDRT